MLVVLLAVVSRPLLQVNGFTTASTVSALVEGVYDARVIAQDALDKHGPVASVAGFADPLIPNGTNGYIANAL